METLKDLWASMIAHISERTTNPFTVAFAVSWSLWNYKFFVVLFSDESPFEKFVAWQYLYPSSQTYWRGGLLFPVLTAIFYVFFYPYIAKEIAKYYRSRQIEMANELKDVENSRIISVVEKVEIIRRHERDLAAANEETARLRSQLDGLRMALARTEENLQEARRQLEDRGLEATKDSREEIPEDSVLTTEHVGLIRTTHGHELSSRELNVLSLLANGALSRDFLVKRLKTPRFWIDSTLDSLTRRNLVKTSAASASLTEAGRTMLAAFIEDGKLALPE